MSFETQRCPLKRPLSGRVVRLFQIQLPKATDANEQKNDSAEESRTNQKKHTKETTSTKPRTTKSGGEKPVTNLGNCETLN